MNPRLPWETLCRGSRRAGAGLASPRLVLPLVCGYDCWWFPRFAPAWCGIIAGRGGRAPLPVQNVSRETRQPRFAGGHKNGLPRQGSPFYHRPKEKSSITGKNLSLLFALFAPRLPNDLDILPVIAFGEKGFIEIVTVRPLIRHTIVDEVSYAVVIPIRAVSALVGELLPKTPAEILRGAAENE